jgi:hypothetical protein
MILDPELYKCASVEESAARIRGLEEAFSDYNRKRGEEKMVLKPQTMSDDMAARVAREQKFQVETEARKWEGAKDLVLRQWCVEKAIVACGADGLVLCGKDEPRSDSDTWNAPHPKCAVVPIAEDILRFITGVGKP